MRDQNDLLPRLVTTEETWLYEYDQQIKQQSMDWRHSGSPSTAPQKFRAHRFAGKVLACLNLFVIKSSSSLILFQMAKTINAEY
jgi:hypothetical protein